MSVVKTAGTTQTFAYDAYGSLTGDAQTAAAVTAYGYDAGSKLTLIDAAGTTNDASFTYDALGRLRTRLVGTVTETYSYVGASETVTRITPSTGTATDSIVTPMGDRLGVKVGTGTTNVNWFLPDLHGNVAASLTSDETKVSNAIRYDAYGQTIATGSAAGTTPVGEKSWKYQGRLDIAPAGLGTPLYEMGARLYSPGLGAFTSLDSVMGKAQNPLSMNRFLYAEANPATMVDPDGHAACSAYADFCDNVPHPGTTKKKRVIHKERQQASYRKKDHAWGYDHGDGHVVEKKTPLQTTPTGCSGSGCRGVSNGRIDVASQSEADWAARRLNGVWQGTGGALIDMATGKANADAIQSGAALAQLATEGGAAAVVDAIGKGIDESLHSPEGQGRLLGGLLLTGGLGLAGEYATTASVVKEASSGGDSALALVRYDPEYASRVLLGQDLPGSSGYGITPSGRPLLPHAAERVALGGGGRSPTTLSRVDEILDKGTKVIYDPDRQSIKVMQDTLPKKPFVVVRPDGKTVITVMDP